MLNLKARVRRLEHQARIHRRYAAVIAEIERRQQAGQQRVKEFLQLRKQDALHQEKADQHSEGESHAA